MALEACVARLQLEGLWLDVGKDFVGGKADSGASRMLEEGGLSELVREDPFASGAMGNPTWDSALGAHTLPTVFVFFLAQLFFGLKFNLF